MKLQNMTYGETTPWSGLLVPVSTAVVGDVCPEQARDRVSGLVARRDDIPAGAFGAATGPRSCSPPV